MATPSPSRGQDASRPHTIQLGANGRRNRGETGGVILGRHKYQWIITVRANDELIRQFEDGEGTKYDMELWDTIPLGMGLYELAFESDEVFDARDVLHIREVAARLRM